MKKIIGAVLVLWTLGGEAWALPYFHLGFNKAYLGENFDLGTNLGPQQSVMTPILEHNSVDGYILIPGVDWNLLNIGASSDTHFGKGALLLGPSIDMGGPLDKLIVKAINNLPQSSNYAGLRSMFSPGSVMAAIMPNWNLTHQRNSSGKAIWKGNTGIMTALTVKFK